LTPVTAPGAVVCHRQPPNRDRPLAPVAPADFQIEMKSLVHFVAGDFVL
jgi:hypothetical protein